MRMHGLASFILLIASACTGRTGDGPPADEVCEMSSSGLYQVAIRCADLDGAQTYIGRGDPDECTTYVDCVYDSGASCTSGECELDCCTEAFRACDDFSHGALCE